MPRPFMTEHQQVGVAGRELDMIEPGVFLVERLELARLDIDREQGVRDLGFEDPGEIIGLVGILLQNRPLLFSRADAPQGRLVGIERRDAPVEVRGKDVDEACSPAGDLGSKNAVSALVEPFSPPRGNDLTENVPPMVGQLFDLQSFEIDGKELSPVGCGSIEHHLVAFARQLRNEWIVVKIEAGIAPFPSGQADQPVAGVLVDPFQRHGLLGAGLQHWRPARREGGLRPCHGGDADQRQHPKLPEAPPPSFAFSMQNGRLADQRTLPTSISAAWVAQAILPANTRKDGTTVSPRPAKEISLSSVRMVGYASCAARTRAGCWMALRPR